MIEKKVAESYKMQQLGVLLRRLPKTHPSYRNIQNEYGKLKAGYYGEKSLNYYLNRATFTKEAIILNDIRLPTEYGDFFQMDVVVLTLYYIMIVEAKNMKGSLYFDNRFRQLIRYDYEKKLTERFPCPLLQVAEQSRHLNAWLNRNNYGDIPIERVVAVTHPNAIIKAPVNYQEATKRVSNLESLDLKASALTPHYISPHSEEPNLKKLTKLFIKQNIEHTPDMMKKFNVHPDFLIKGIECPNCSTLPIERIHGTWRCPNCNHTFKSAHLLALLDHVLLFGSSISNQLFREIIQIDSRSISQKLLQELKFRTKGDLRNYFYDVTAVDLQKKIERSKELQSYIKK